MSGWAVSLLKRVYWALRYGDWSAGWDPEEDEQEQPQ